MERKIIITSDGSHSIYIPELNEHYHSIHGAIQESKHVFIEAGLKHFAEITPKINVFEAGMGTGLNAFLTLLEASKLSLKINYTAIEAFPLSKEITDELNYAELLNAGESQHLFDSIHDCEWKKKNFISPFFQLNKIKNTLQEIILENEKFDLIYFDAFGPPVQPEMWTETIFRKIYNATRPNGILVTYCAKGEVKRTLKKVGFRIEELPGPPGKREMIRAVK